MEDEILDFLGRPRFMEVIVSMLSNPFKLAGMFVYLLPNTLIFVHLLIKKSEHEQSRRKRHKLDV